MKCLSKSWWRVGQKDFRQQRSGRVAWSKKWYYQLLWGGHDCVPLDASNRYLRSILNFCLGWFWVLLRYQLTKASQWWAAKRVIRSTGWGSSLLLPTTSRSSRSSSTTTTAPSVHGESARSNSGQAKVLTVESGVFSALIPRIALLLILLPCPGESDSSMFSTYFGKWNGHETKAIINCECHIC